MAFRERVTIWTRATVKSAKSHRRVIIFALANSQQLLEKLCKQLVQMKYRRVKDHFHCSRIHMPPGFIWYTGLHLTDDQER